MTNQRGTASLLIIATLIILMAVGVVAAVMKFRTTPNPGDNVESVDTSSLEREVAASCGDITQPQSGSIVASGSEVPVVADFKGEVGETIELVSHETGDNTPLDVTTGKGVLKIPNTHSGSMEFSLVGVKAENVICSGASLVLLVRPQAAITKLHILPLKITMFQNQTKQILVSAEFDDGVDRSANSPVVGTVYVSADPSIVSVDEEGLITAHKPGNTTINVTNGKLFENITVHVLEGTGDDV